MHPKLPAIHDGNCNLLSLLQKGKKVKINVHRCTCTGGGVTGHRVMPGQMGLLILGVGVERWHIV
jgi:hypothetical protein